jgi:hypothetical protein
MAVWAVIICMVVGSVGISESFKDCEHTRKDHKIFRPLHEERTIAIKAIVRLKLHAYCTIEAAHENEGLLTLLATILVAGFTGTLWFETNRLWRAGEKQIIAVKESTNVAERTLVAAQRAWVRVDITVNGDVVFD